MDDNNVHFGSDDKATARWRFFARRVVLLPLVALIFVGVGVWVFTSVHKNTQKKQTTLQSAISASDAATQVGDYGKSLDQLKAAQSNASSKQEKIELYNSMAAAAYNSGKLDEAVGYLEKKHELDPSSVKADSYIMGTYYEQIGDNTKAIEQYKIYIEYKKSQATSKQTSSDISSLEARIQDLGGQ